MKPASIQNERGLERLALAGDSVGIFEDEQAHEEKLFEAVDLGWPQDAQVYWRASGSTPPTVSWPQVRQKPILSS